MIQTVNMIDFLELEGFKIHYDESTSTAFLRKLIEQRVSNFSFNPDSIYDHD